MRTTAVSPRFAQMDVPPLPRCCPRHADWLTLGDHLVLDFTDVSAGEVLEELGVAQQAVDRVRLADDDGALLIAELIARHRLMIKTGRLPDVARLDPERHHRQPQPAACD